jgi:two-component system cell cycle sensor histidine kinase/response regulator CckA
LDRVPVGCYDIKIISWADKSMVDKSPDAATRPHLGTLLVADDDELVRMVLSDMLQELGYSVLSAADSTQAVDVFRENQSQIDAVILDYKMPGLSGDEVFEELKLIDPAVKVLLSSGFSDTIDLDSLRSRGLRGFLPKPYTMERIHKELQAILG